MPRFQTALKLSTLILCQLMLPVIYGVSWSKYSLTCGWSNHSLLQTNTSIAISDLAQLSMQSLVQSVESS